jgi:hypothetical protein
MILCLKFNIGNKPINSLDRIVSLVIIPDKKSLVHKSIRT